jgi:hypothetical protein
MDIISQSLSSTSPSCILHSQPPLTPGSPLVTWYNTHHCASVAHSTPDSATQRMQEHLYAGHLSTSRSISTRPGEVTRVFESPPSSEAATNPPSTTSLLPVQRTRSSTISTSYSDASMRRRHTHFRIRHLDIEIHAAEATLTQLREQRLQLVDLLMYDNIET